MAWNTGERLTSRGRPSSWTTLANGTSACSNPSSTVRRVRSSSSVNVGSSPRSARSGSMLMNMPTRFSSSGADRPATDAPIAKSSWPECRASSTWYAASSVMNSVPPLSRVSVLSASVAAGSSWNSTKSPRYVWVAGRGRSSGSSSGVMPASRCFQ